MWQKAVAQGIIFYRTMLRQLRNSKNEDSVKNFLLHCFQLEFKFQKDKMEFSQLLLSCVTLLQCSMLISHLCIKIGALTATESLK